MTKLNIYFLKYICQKCPTKKKRKKAWDVFNTWKKWAQKLLKGFLEVFCRNGGSTETHPQNHNPMSNCEMKIQIQNAH
jgi:hypothetical protein